MDNTENGIYLVGCDDNCRQFISDGSILVQNYGDYKVRYDIKGKQNETKYCCSSDEFGRDQQYGLPIPISEEIELTVEYEDELFSWASIFIQDFPFSNITKCYQTEGNKANATYIEIICSSQKRIP